ncbi:MAG: hypothetical protein K8T89_14285 [Planctomycetes bacterium]|nr:hypothetical protein [Planctomycetota bacterium]
MPTVSCSQCGKSGNIPEQYIGRKIKCKQCASIFVAMEEIAAPAPRRSALSDLDIARETLDLIPASFARDECVLPIKRNGDKLLIAVPEGTPKTTIEKLKFIFNLKLDTLSASHDDLVHEIDRRYSPEPAAASKKASTPTRPAAKATHFECSRPKGDGICSDDSCPCGEPGAVISRGTGYLYISEEVVKFRQDVPTESAAMAKVRDVERTLDAKILNPKSLATPILMCKLGARNRGLDMKIAAEDAKHWWQTGEVPLRPTPTTAPAPQAKKESPEEAALNKKRNELVTKCITSHCIKTGEFISEQKAVQWTAGVMRLNLKQVEKLLSDKAALERFVPKLAASPSTAWAGV